MARNEHIYELNDHLISLNEFDRISKMVFGRGPYLPSTNKLRKGKKTWTLEKN